MNIAQSKKSLETIDEIEDTQIFPSQALQFKDGCEIEQTAHGYIVKEGEQSLHFDRQDKPVFNYQTGKIVREFTGLATDKNEHRSWAEAVFDPNGGTAPGHFHKHRMVDYYIVLGNECAFAIVEGKKHPLTTGSHVRVLPNQINKVVNDSQTEKLVLLVKVEPSWAPEDHHLVT